jgi:PPOX class probable F420-dependent enzyme
MFSRRDGKLYVRSEPGPKVRRARRNPHVRVARCNVRGRPKSPVYEGTARELPPDEQQRAHDILFEGYAPGVRLYERTADRMPVELAYLEISPVEPSP